MSHLIKELLVFNRPLKENKYLVEVQFKIPKKSVQKSIPYKYAVYRDSEQKLNYETIYQKEESEYINRCLSVKQKLLTSTGILNNLKVKADLKHH